MYIQHQLVYEPVYSRKMPIECVVIVWFKKESFVDCLKRHRVELVPCRGFLYEK